MKVTMTDTVETAHTIVPEIEEGVQIVLQDGLRILSAQRASAGGLSGENFVLLLSKGAALELPDRLAKRLIKTGHAAACGKTEG